MNQRPALTAGAQEAGLEALINTGLFGGSEMPPFETNAVGTITVFIPAHNEQASVGATLRSLRRQTRLPTRVVVICDNCTDRTPEIAARYGALIFRTNGNTAKKAGALNQALTRVLPSLHDDDFVLTMDADSLLSDDWLRAASAILTRDPEAGAVCSLYVGEPGGGLIGQLQRNEYMRAARSIRRRSQVTVLSGTGTLFRVSALRAVACERGRRLPGSHGEFCSRTSITEDGEITLALKTLGYRCLVAADCRTITEVMPTWRHLWRQRVRWQTGTLGDLRSYGLSRVTAIYWLLQLDVYAGLVLWALCWWIITASLIGHFGINVAWCVVVTGISFIERLWTVRRAGSLGMLLSILMVPEFLYDVFRMGVYIRALAGALAGHEIAWNHVRRQPSR